MDNKNNPNKQPQTEETSADREKHNPFQYDTGISEEELGTEGQAELEQERKEALTERD